MEEGYKERKNNLERDRKFVAFHPLFFQNKILDSHSKPTAKLAFIHILGIFRKTSQPCFSSIETVLDNSLEIGLFSPGKGTNTFSQCL